MSAAGNFRCVIIGEGALPIICGEMLIDQGHEILAVASPDQHVSQWAQSNAIATATEPSALASLIEGQEFDYLLSITNFQKLPDSLLNAARRGAINYHDAPLPRYAGSHATSWALLNGETRHAVTWHLLTSRIDGGDILKQVPVDIDPDETALTLNAKCFEAAIDGFCALLDDMEADALDPRPQNRAERSFYRRSQRPPAGCTLRFDAPAEQLRALVRALDFGSYPNPLGLPKIALGESFAIVTTLDVLDSASGGLPGTITAITAEHLIVTTASHDVALGGFLTIDGVPMPIAEVVECGELRVGASVAAVEEARATRLTSLCAELSEHEAFWMAQLADARPTTLPYALHAAGPQRRSASHTVTFGTEIQSLDLPDFERGGDRLLVAFMAYLVCLTGTGMVDIAFNCMQLCSDMGGLWSFISGFLPLRLRGSQERGVHQLTQSLGAQLQHVHARRSYVRDAPVRDPTLRAQLYAIDLSSWPICVELLDDVAVTPMTPLHPGRVLTVRLATDGDTCTLVYDPDVLDPALVEQMAREFMIFVKALPTRVVPPIHMLQPDPPGAIGTAPSSIEPRVPAADRDFAGGLPLLPTGKNDESMGCRAVAGSLEYAHHLAIDWPEHQSDGVSPSE